MCTWNTQMSSNHVFGPIPYIWMAKKSYFIKGKCKHLLFSSSLGNTNTLTQMCSRVCIPLPWALVFNVYSCGDENSKISCHRWENLAQNSTFTVGWQIWMGFLASQNQRKLKIRAFKSPCLGKYWKESRQRISQW